MTCAEVEELAAELALGGVGGAERAAALAHLARCDACRTLVDQLARAADTLLLLAPAVEPPAGFESRVLARIAAAAEPVPLRRPSRRRLWLGAAAVALVAAMSGVGVAELGHHDRGGHITATAPVAAVRTALAQDPAGRWMCQAVLYGTQPTRMVVSLDRTDGLSAGFTVEAVPVGTTDAVPVGSFSITDGHGSLATTVDLTADQVKGIRVLDSTGKVRYEATFSPGS